MSIIFNKTVYVPENRQIPVGHSFNLTSVIIGNNVEVTERSAFEYSESLTSITIPNSVRHIGWWALS